MECYFDEHLNLVGTSASSIDFSGSFFSRGIKADRLNAPDGLTLGKGFTAKGEVSLREAKIDGNLACGGGTFDNPGEVALACDGMKVGGYLLLRGIRARGAVRLFGAKVGGGIECDDGTFDDPGGIALNGTGMEVAQYVYLRAKFRAMGEVRLEGAKVGGNLDCHSGNFDNPGGIALDGTGMDIRGYMLLRDGFRARGAVRLFGAKIGGGIECDEGTFDNPGGIALDGTRVEVAQYVHLRGASFRAGGEVRLQGAKVGGNLDCHSGSFDNPGEITLNCTGMDIKGYMLLRDGFRARGAVSLFGAKVGGGIECDDGTFDHPGGIALDGTGMEVAQYVHLRGASFRAGGEVRLDGAKVGGNLDCHSGNFDNPGEITLNCTGMDIKGYMLLRDGFRARGAVSLFGAKIGGGIECDEGTFDNPGGMALDGTGMEVAQYVYLRANFRAMGEVRLQGAKIGGNLECLDASFANAGRAAIVLRNARVTGSFIWSAVLIQGSMDLQQARVGWLADDAKSWPERDPLFLDGFEYEALSGDAPVIAEDRLRWLARQPEDDFRSQPYEQLARVLRHMGRERDAREVAIAKQEAIRRYGRLTRAGRIWNWLLGTLVAHGYKPWRVLWIALAVIAFGALIFWSAEWSHAVQPVKQDAYSATPTTVRTTTPVGARYIPSCTLAGWLLGTSASRMEATKAIRDDYPPFCAPLYSLDVFLPVVDLHQESYWLPSVAKPFGWIYWAYMWLHILMGWALTTVLVATLTGFIKKD